VAFACVTSNLEQLEIAALAWATPTVATNLTSLKRAIITFRTQKNGDNGETRVFTANTSNTRLCFVRLIFHIFRQFIRLVGWEYDTPLCIYRETTGAICLITATNIKSAMRAAAAAVYNLCPSKNRAELQRWSAHSLRVGACVILHAMGFVTLVAGACECHV
jgi:hypothetical protein